MTQGLVLGVLDDAYGAARARVDRREYELPTVAGRLFDAGRHLIDGEVEHLRGRLEAQRVPFA